MYIYKWMNVAFVVPLIWDIPFRDLWMYVHRAIQRLLECITPTMQSCSHMSERRSFKKHIWYEKSENESIHIKLLKFDTIMHGFTIGIFWKSTWVSAFVFSLNVWTLSISNLSSNMQRKDTRLRLKRKWRTNK